MYMYFIYIMYYMYYDYKSVTMISILENIKVKIKVKSITYIYY